MLVIIFWVYMQLNFDETLLGDTSYYFFPASLEDFSSPCEKPKNERQKQNKKKRLPLNNQYGETNTPEE